MNKRDAFTAELRGGLGNQLFILAAALTIAEKMNTSLVLDARFFDGKGPQGVQIRPIVEHLPYEISIIDGHRSASEKVLRKIRRAAKSSRLFIESGFDYDPKIIDIRQNQILSGYFQSPHYFSEKVSESLSEAFMALTKQNPTTPSKQNNVHIRRGDYLDQHNLSAHGIATYDYFDRGIQLLRKLNQVREVKIFTDSPEILSEEHVEKWNATVENPSEAASPLESLLNLSNCGGIVASNSSFSWWAAWIATKRNTNTTVICPRPWLANGSSAHTLLLPEWMTLG